MPTKTKKRPYKPAVEPNLRHGGRASDTCPRCGLARSKKKTDGKPLHGIPELVDSADLRGVLRTVDDNLRSDSELTGDPDCGFMMGVLEARIDNKEYYLIASSGWNKKLEGPWIQPKHLKNITYHRGEWETVNPKIPDQEKREEWWTVRGARVELSPTVDNLTKPCSAIKLLLGLGAKKLAWNSVGYVRMSEMAYVGSNASAKIRAIFKNWHGKGATNSWTAHSCKECEARVPYLICDVPTNMIDP
ncbi:hypothetical protein [Frankia gtarii]|uniref:hypothetical protein n=1 Tax=Frankia gtarii TaxID=2950102 RepID=UPI0021C1B8C8|nr:hypothetical protein [Frankia gtarii]